VKLRVVVRLLEIQRVLLKHGLDDYVRATHLYRPLRFMFFLSPGIWFERRRAASRGARLRLALEELGPIFVKFGQAVSTRRDLLPADIADELAKLQDRVPPFPGSEARQLIEKSYGRSVTQVFAQFDETPLAAASIAQVHVARLHGGEEVVVKVLRPGMRAVIERDLEVLHALADLAQRYWAEGRQLLYVPEIYWDYCRSDVIVMERIHGVPISDLASLKAAGTDIARLAENGVRIFFTQVFRHNFFHADMHPGNIFVLIDDPQRPRYAAVDFGIVGTLDPRDQHYLAENFLAVFDRDYRRVAQLHLESGWVPADARVDEMESAVRTVCEPIFDRPLKDISFGRILLRLFEISRRFNVQIQPQLILLQKTLLNVEGLGRDLYPELDIWSTASPILREWMRERTSVRALVRSLRLQAPEIMTAARGLPLLLQRLLRAPPAVPAASPAAELQALRAELRAQRRQRDAVTLGAMLFLAGFGWLALARAPAWLGWGLVAAGAAKLLYGLWR
jgi:ubiquinone biosynthesis protein